MDTKQQMLKAIEELPDDASVEDALERLYLLYKIVRATRQWELQIGEWLGYYASGRNPAPVIKIDAISLPK